MQYVSWIDPVPLFHKSSLIILFSFHKNRAHCDTTIRKKNTPVFLCYPTHGLLIKAKIWLSCCWNEHGLMIILFLTHVYLFVSQKSCQEESWMWQRWPNLKSAKSRNFKLSWRLWMSSWDLTAGPSSGVWTVSFTLHLWLSSPMLTIYF